jgi:hypothetical protein
MIGWHWTIWLFKFIPRLKSFIIIIIIIIIKFYF